LRLRQILRATKYDKLSEVVLASSIKELEGFAPYVGGAPHTHTPTTNGYTLSEEDNTSTPLPHLHLKEADDLRGEKLLLTA
jgi:hypothetical protein